jgi:hypothetical protein
VSNRETTTTTESQQSDTYAGASSTTSNTIAPYVEAGSQQAVEQAQAIAGREYTPYTGERIAGMTSNEQAAYDLAAQGVGSYSADMNRSRELAEQASMSILDADMEGYMNPYTSQALDPILREIDQSRQQDVNAAGQQAAAAGAFGGSRATLLESEANELGYQRYDDAVVQGYERAYNDAVMRFNEDRNAAAFGATTFANLGAQEQQMIMNDVTQLMQTGGVQRAIEQAGLDFNFTQFLEERDWDITNLQPLLQTLSTIPFSTTQTNESETRTSTTASGESTTEQQGSLIGTIMGLASVAASFMPIPSFGGSGGVPSGPASAGSFPDPGMRVA